MTIKWKSETYDFIGKFSYWHFYNHYYVTKPDDKGISDIYIFLYGDLEKIGETKIFIENDKKYIYYENNKFELEEFKEIKNG